MFRFRKILFILIICGAAFLAPSLLTAAPGWLKESQSTPMPDDLHDDISAVLCNMTYTTRISSNGSAVTDIRQVVRIMKGGGSAYSGVVELITPNRKVTGVKGWLIDKNGVEQTLQKDNIVEFATAIAAGSYNDSKSLMAGFPNVSAGDIIGYEYTIKEDKGSEGLYKKYDFQQSIPVLSAEISLALPNNWQLQYYSQNLDSLSYSVDAENVHYWKIGRQRFYPDEPFMPHDATIKKYVFVNCHLSEDSEKEQFSSWSSVAAWAFERYASQYVPDETIRGLANRLTAGAKTNREKLEVIAAHVRDEIRYVAIEFGEGRFQPRAASQTCELHYGDCKDKATMMVSLLQCIGITSHPVLVSSDSHIDTMITTPYQFNHVIIAIPELIESDAASFAGAVSDGWLYFDPTDQSTQFGYLPSGLYGKYCLHVANESTALRRLPEKIPEFDQREYRVDATLHPDNSIAATVRITDRNMQAGELAYTIRNSGVDELIEQWRQTLAQSIQNLEINDFRSGFAEDSAWLEFEVSGDKYIEVSGDLNLLKADFIHSDRKSEMKKKADRYYPVDFGSPRMFLTEIHWTFPEGWSIDEGLDSAADSCQLASIEYTAERVDGAYRFYSKLVYLGGQVANTGYESARNFDRTRCAVYSRKYFISKS